MLELRESRAVMGVVAGALSVLLGLVLAASASATYDLVGHAQTDADAIATDSAGNLYAAYNVSPESGAVAEVRKYDPEGNLLATIGSYGNGEGQFHGVGALAVDGAGNLFVAAGVGDGVDPSVKIEKFDPRGNFLTKWGDTGSGPGQFENVSALATDAAGDVYVADPLNDRIEKFDSDGNFITQWGGTGTADGQFDGPGGIAVDDAGVVYVTDQRNDRVQKFDSDGNFLGAWGRHGSRPGRLYTPLGITVAGDGVFVMDFNNNRVQEFDQAGALLESWSTPYGRDVAAYIDTGGRTYVYANPGGRYGPVPLDTRMETHPTSTTPDRTPTFTFGATGSATGFDCSLDSGPFLPCSSPLTLPRQPDGYHDLRVRGRNDDLGYVDQTPVSASITIDSHVGAKFDIAGVQAQQAGSIEVDVAAALTNDGWDRSANLEAAGRIVVKGRRLTTNYDLQRKAVAFPGFLDVPGLVRLTPDAPGAGRKISSALTRGAKVRARITATLSDPVGNRLKTKRVIRLEAAR